MSSSQPVRMGLVGFGSGGMIFHAPYIDAAQGVELAGIVTRDPARRQLASQLYPGVPVFASMAEMAASTALDAVTLTTPPQTRRDLVLQALGLGLHVVADKPFAPDAQTARELEAAAQGAQRQLAVFHNRRWDSDIRSLLAVRESGQLGAIRRFHSRFDLDQPGSMEAGPSGGLLRDLGSHLVDQALWLFGPVRQVHARLDWVGSSAERVDAGFVLSLQHASGVDSHLSASKLNRLNERELRLYGAAGSYLARSTDVQAAAASQGLRPRDNRQGWGFEPPSAWGTLSTAAGRQSMAAVQGDYTLYYEQFARAVRHAEPLPVSATEAVAVLEVLDAARRSDALGAVVHLPSALS
jgi:predicted dehydrogenase